MTHPFLSDEWMAAARAIRDKHADGAPPVPYQIRMNQIVTDVPFGDGTLKTFLDTSTGAIVMEKGELANADVTVTTDYETAKEMFVSGDPNAALTAFMAGKIRIQGDLAKMMAAQTSGDAATNAALLEAIQGITE